jgi:serine/threonine protein kinase
MDPKNVQQ